jgi:hypothetical protein
LASAQKPDQLLGRWKVTAVATACPVTAMSGSAAARLVGQPLTLTRHTVHFARQTCRPIYELSKETLAEVSQEYKIDAKALKLPDPVIRVDADCTEVFIREPGKILFTWNGYFLEATRSSAAGD